MLSFWWCWFMTVGGLRLGGLTGFGGIEEGVSNDSCSFSGSV